MSTIFDGFGVFEPRLLAVLELITRIGAGDYRARAPVSAPEDPLDAVVVALHLLAESFERERTLRAEAEARLEDAVDAWENAPGLYCSVSPGDWRIVQANRALAAAVDQRPAALAGVDFRTLAAPSARAAVEAALESLAAGSARAHEVELARPDGSPLYAVVTGTVSGAAPGRASRLRLLLRDTTAEHRLEAQLAQAQKMEAVGRLAGGIAHDFNNFLTVMQLGLLLLEKSAPAVAQSGELEVVRTAAESAAGLTRQLLAFARDSAARPEVLEVRAAVLRLEPLLRRLLGDAVELTVRADSDARVRIDPTRLEQVVVNLAVNARDAMPRGGAITVAVQDGPPGRAQLTVSDTGEGIPPEVLPRIFEPFFTTKPLGKGTGLGLSMVYAIVTRAGGEVAVDSRPGRGTRITVRLPCTDEPVPAPPAPPPRTCRRPARVLVVDDDATARAMIAQVLRHEGFSAAEAGSGDEALAQLEREPADVLVSDASMPGMSGAILAAEATRRWPALRVLLVSGDAGVEPPPGVELLAKPFGSAALVEALARVLAAQPAAGAPSTPGE